MMKKGGGKYGDQVRNTTQHTLCCIAYSASGLATCSERSETGARDSPHSLQITRGSLSRDPRRLCQHKSYHGGTKGQEQGVTTGTCAALHQRTGRAATPRPHHRSGPRGAWGGRREPGLSGCLGKGGDRAPTCPPPVPALAAGPRAGSSARAPCAQLTPTPTPTSSPRATGSGNAHSPRRAARPRLRGETLRGNHGNGPPRAGPQSAGRDSIPAKAKCSCFKFPADKFLNFSWSRRPQAPDISPMPYPLIMLNLYRLFKPFLFLEGK